MKLVQELAQTILESFTLRRVLALPILIAVVTAVVRGSTALAEFLSRREEHTLLGIPALVWGLFAGILLILYFVAQYATRLRLTLVPKFDVHFNPTREGIVTTRTEVYQPSEANKWTPIRTDQAAYVRITVRTLSLVTVRRCVAFLTKVEKRTTVDSKFAEITNLDALLLTPNPIDVYPRVPATIDFLKAGQFDNKLEFSVPIPFRLEGILDDHATYRFTVEVNGDGASKAIIVELDWSGQWNKITARQV